MKEIKTTRKYDGHLKIDLIELLGEKNNIITREVVSKRSAVGGVIYNTKTKKYIFVKQWRPGLKDYIIEIAAGVLDIQGEEPKNCMIREVMEETGYITDSIFTLVNEYYSSPGFTDEKLTLFYVEVSNQITTKLGVEDEEIELIEMSFDEMLNNLSNFKDSKTILALNQLLLNLYNDKEFI